MLCTPLRSWRLELLHPAASAIPTVQLLLLLQQTIFPQYVNTIYYMLLHSTKLGFIQFILVTEQRHLYSDLYAHTHGMCSLWPKKKRGEKRKITTLLQLTAFPFSNTPLRFILNYCLQ